jgi:hypothetical protein
MSNFLTIEEQLTNNRFSLANYLYVRELQPAIDEITRISTEISDFDPYINAVPLLLESDQLANEDVKVLEDPDELLPLPSTIIYCPMIYDRENRLTPNITKNKFSSAISLLSTLPGIERGFLLFLGPNSRTPWHVDNSDRSPYTPSQLYNVIVSIKIPSFDKTVTGVKINGTVLNVNTPIIFDSQIPHQGWNYTDNMWLSALFLIDKKYFK